NVRLRLVKCNGLELLLNPADFQAVLFSNQRIDGAVITGLACEHVTVGRADIDSGVCKSAERACSGKVLARKYLPFLSWRAQQKRSVRLRGDKVGALFNQKTGLLALVLAYVLQRTHGKWVAGAHLCSFHARTDSVQCGYQPDGSEPFQCFSNRRPADLNAFDKFVLTRQQLPDGILTGADLARQRVSHDEIAGTPTVRGNGG